MAHAEHACIIGDLAPVRAGRAMAFDECGAICGGAKRYLGFAPALREGFEYFLSYGIPGKMEGERYVKVSFEKAENGIKVTEDFEPETENSHELQQQGWQAILENFKKYVDSSNK